MAEVTGMEWPTIQEKEWPHGVRCMDCRTQLTQGDPYIERMEGFVEETPTTEVVCLTCGGGLPV
jgi:hypothetical protein